MTTAVTLYVGSKLADNAQWTNRFEIVSESSDRVYVISQNKAKRHWACSCPAWRTRRYCKHLDTLGLPGYCRPHEAKIEAATKTFMGCYKRRAGVRGSPGDWQAAFHHRMGVDVARALLGDESPQVVLKVSLDAQWPEIRSAYRAQSRETHPDLGGNPDAFRRVQAAFEILEHMRNFV